MTMIYIETKKCSICQRKSAFLKPASTTVYGLGDMDFRGNFSMQSLLIDCELEECPHCGYIAPNIEENGEEFIKFKNTVLYSFFFGNEFKKIDASVMRFIKFSIFMEWERNFEIAAENILKAAWKLEDLNDEKGALKCRCKAIELLRKVTNKNDRQMLILADLYRRTAQFEAVENLLSGMKCENSYYEKIAQYQIVLAKNKDDERHCIEEAMLCDLDENNGND